MQATAEMWVTFKLANRYFGLSTGVVKEMAALPEVRSVPNAPACVRGVTNLRGKVHTVWDLRQLLGLNTLSQETEDLITTLTQREEDHKNWLAELEASVREQRPFKLTTDPHKCKFGLWYDRFTTDNLILSALLKKFDEPHKRIHALGTQVCECMQSNRTEDALRLIETTRQGDLQALILLFEQTRQHVRTSHNEIGIVLNLDRHAIILTADSILSVEQPAEKNSEDLEKMRGSLETDLNFIETIGHLKNDAHLIMLLDPQKLNIATDFVPDLSH